MLFSIEQAGLGLSLSGPTFASSLLLQLPWSRLLKPSHGKSTATGLALQQSAPSKIKCLEVKGGHLFLAIAILHASTTSLGNSKEEEAYWSAYASTLPRLEASRHFPLLWSEAELSDLGCGGTLLSLKIKRKQDELSCHWECICSLNTGLEALSFEDFLWSVCMVESRAMYNADGEEFIAPVADLANHIDRGSEAEWELNPNPNPNPSPKW